MMWSLLEMNSFILLLRLLTLNFFLYHVCPVCTCDGEWWITHNHWNGELFEVRFFMDLCTCRIFGHSLLTSDGMKGGFGKIPNVPNVHNHKSNTLIPNFLIKCEKGKKNDKHSYKMNKRFIFFCYFLLKNVTLNPLAIGKRIWNSFFGRMVCVSR